MKRNGHTGVIASISGGKRRQMPPRPLKDGDTILTCGHVGQEVFEVVGRAPSADPRDRGLALVAEPPVTWPGGRAYHLAVCRRCWEAAGRNVRRVIFRAHFAYRAPAPIAAASGG